MKSMWTKKPLPTCGWLLALALVLTVTTTQGALFGSKKKDKDKDQVTAPEPPPIPVNLPPANIVYPPPTNAPKTGSFWDDPEFVARFMGSYGFNSEIEPKFNNTNETALYKQVSEAIGNEPAKAIYLLETNLTQLTFWR